MDTGKILKVILDIQDEERNFDLQTKFKSILTQYSQSDFGAISEGQTIIRNAVLESELSKYALTDFEVLQKLGADNFFGPGSYQSLQRILNRQANEVQPELEKFVSERSGKLTALDQLKTSLTNFGFNSRKLDDSNYEIGLALPSEYSDLDRIEDLLQDIKLFLSALTDATSTQQPLRITYVSNGSIQLFIHSTLELAQHFDIVLDHALQIYGAVKGFNEIKEQYKKRFSDKRRKTLEKETEAQKKETVEKLIDELIRKLNIKDPDKKNRVKELFIVMLKHIEKGVAPEVVTPSIAPPVEPPVEASAEEKKEYKKASLAFEAKLEIDNRNREIFILQQNNFYGMDTKFLASSGQEENEE